MIDAARGALRPRHRDQRRVVPDRARPAGGHAAPGHRRRDAASSRSSTPAAAPRMRASSRATARSPSSAWSAPPCIRRTSACRLPNCATSRAFTAASSRPSWHERSRRAGGAPQLGSIVLGVMRLARGRADGLAPVRRHARSIPGQPGAADRLSAGGRRADAAGRRRPDRALSDLLATLCALVAPPVLSFEVARLWGRQDAWLRFATAFNWCQWVIPVIGSLLLVVLGMLAALGLPRPLRCRVVLGLVSLWPVAALVPGAPRSRPVAHRGRCCWCLG